MFGVINSVCRSFPGGHMEHKRMIIATSAYMPKMIRGRGRKSRFSLTISAIFKMLKQTPAMIVRINHHFGAFSLMPMMDRNSDPINGSAAIKAAMPNTAMTKRRKSAPNSII